MHGDDALKAPHSGVFGPIEQNVQFCRVLPSRQSAADEEEHETSTDHQAPSLYGRDGRRKYLTGQERSRFIAAAKLYPRKDIGTVCLVLAYSGCRISEALAMTRHSVNAEDGTIALESLKKRGVFVVREIPMPDDVMKRLAELAGRRRGKLWLLSRSRAWQLVKEIMAQAGILPGLQTTPKGLRHGFGVHAIRSGVPITLVQRWLGHASLSTTAIYTQVLGCEERDIASRMWTVGTQLLSKK